MSAADPFVERIVASLLPLGHVQARRMFGGWGIFHEATMFAIVAGGRLYLKADGKTEARFTSAGLAPFTYLRQGRLVALSYREAPPQSLNDPAVLRDWARLALEAAARMPRRKARRRPWPNSLP